MCIYGNIIIRLLMVERMSELKIYSRNYYKIIFLLDLRNLYLFFYIIVWIKWIYVWFRLGIDYIDFLVFILYFEGVNYECFIIFILVNI